MHWKQPLILLGLLAAVGTAAPLAPLEADIDEVVNITSQHVEKRALQKMPYPLTKVWRTDGRSPAQIKASRGFQTKGTFNHKKEDLSLYRHCLGAKSGASMDNDGFVSTTWYFPLAETWVLDHHKGSAYVYRIATDEQLIDVQGTLKGYNPYPKEYEFAAVDQIPWEQVQGWYQYTYSKSQGTRQGPYVMNKDFSQSRYGGQEHGGKQFPLAGFPKGHAAWKELPWARYAHCQAHNAKRAADDIFAPQSPADLDGIPSDALESEITTLEARGRARSSRKSRTKTTAAGRRKKAAKKTTKKTKTAAGTKKCTAAMKKAGKCKTTTTAKCTAAMKKAGKCKTTTTAKCTAAMKKAGKCKTTTTAKCTAAEKKKNGGKCPVQCSAAEKKNNGGVCPTCTAAEKKENGGICPVCTAEEKKKNGGKCPKSKGTCGPTVSNYDRYQEYLKAIKAKKAGKKMKWSEGSGTSTVPKAKTGKATA